MTHQVWSQVLRWLSGHRSGVWRWARRRLGWALVVALITSLLPWTPPSFTPIVQSALSGAPQSVQWAAPMALSITGWADRALAALGSAPVYAGDNITLTLSKRDDGLSLTPLLPVGPDPLVPGSPLIYYIEVVNTGSITATVHLTETLPEGLTCADAWRVPGYDGGADWYGPPCSGRQVRLYTLDVVPGGFFDGLGPGRSAVLYVAANVQWPVEDGHVFTNATTSYEASASQEPAYTYTGSNEVTTTVHAPRLAIAKVATPQQVWIGDEITFTLAISNSGHYALTAPFTLTVVDPFPAGASLVRYTSFPGTAGVVASASAITWTIPFTSGGNADLVPGEVLTATLVVAASGPFTHTGRMTNTGYSVSISPTMLTTPALVSGADVSVQVQSHPSLTITKAGPATPVHVSQDWTYWITVTNAADAMGNAVGLVITDVVPVTTVLQSISAGAAQSTQSSCPFAGCVITWTYPSTYSLSWGESTAVSFTVRAALGAISGTLVTNALYGVTATNALAAVTGAPVTTTLRGSSHLYAAKTAQPTLISASVDHSDLITFTIAVTNLNDATAEAAGVTITDTIPTGAELVSARFSVGSGTVLSPSVSAGSVVTWLVNGGLPQDHTVMGAMVVHVVTPIDDGSTISDQAFVSAQGDYTETNVARVTVASAPHLDISKTASAATIAPGAYLTYTIMYTSSGTMNAYHTTLTDTLPDLAHVSLVSAIPEAAPVGRQLVWDLGTVRGHNGSTPGTGSVTVVVTVTRPLTNGTVLANRAVVSSDGGGYAATGDVTTTVSSAIDLALAKLPDDGLATPGEVITYTVLYTNTANATSSASNLTITDRLPPYIVGGTASQGPNLGTIAAGTTVTWYVAGPLAPGEGGAITLWLTTTRAIPDRTILTNTARIEGGQGAWAEDTAVYTVRSPDITVSKDATPATVRAGGLVTFTVMFSNFGGAAATNVRITDTLPVSLTLVSSSATGALFEGHSGQDYVWTAGSVPAGSAGAITLTAQVTTAPGWINPAGTTYLTNAVVASAAVDVVPSNNTDDSTIAIIAGTPGVLSLDISPSTIPVPGPAAITVTLTDSYGNPVYNGDGYTVSLTSAPAGAVLGASVVAIGNGRGTTAISSTVAGTYQVTASVASMPAISGTAAVTFTANSLDRFVIGPIGDQTAGLSFTVGITAVDRYGNRVLGFAGPASMRDTAAPNTLQPPTTALFDQGLLASQQVTITLARVNRAIEVYTGTVTSASQPFTVSVGAPGLVTVTTSASTIRLGENATANVTVADAYDNRVAGEPLSFGIGPVGTVYPATAVSSGSGTATCAISSTVVGTATVVVTASNGVTGTAPGSFIPGAPAAITVTVVPSTTPVGSSAGITVEVRDAYGNGVNWDAVTLTTVDPLGTGSISPATAIALDANGRAVSAISSTIPGLKTVLARAQSNGYTATGVVTFTVGTAQSIDLVMSPNPQEVGLDASLSATVRDAFGNPRAGDVITFSVLPGVLGGGGIVPLVGTTSAQGVATAAISSTLATGTPVTATLAEPGPVLSDTEWASFTAGPPAAITLTVNPAEVEAGISATLTVTMTDRYGNACQGQQATFSVAPSAYVLTGPGVNTWIAPNPATAGGSGVATAAISSTLVGQVTITVQGPSAYTSTAVLTITPGALHHFLVTPVPDPIMAGEVVTLGIRAADVNGLVLSTATGWISITDQTGTILPTAAWMVNGLANVDWTITRTMTNDWIAVRWASNPAISATTNLFTVTAGLPYTVALDYAPVMAACRSQVITATVRDTHGNLVPEADVEVLSLGVGVVTPGGVIPSDANGVVTTTFSSNQAGAAVVQFTVDGVGSVAAFAVEASAPTALDLVASPALIQAGGSAMLMATVTDCGGNRVPDQVISATLVSGYGTLTPLAGTTDASGQVGFTLTATRTGVVSVRAFDAATGLVQDTATVTVEPGCPATVAMSANPQGIGINGGRSTIVATVMDAYGNPLPGSWVAFGTSGASGTLNPTGGTTDVAGMVTTTLTSAFQLGDVSVVGTVSEAFCPIVSGTAVVHIGGSVVYLPVVLRDYSSMDLRVANIQVVPEAGGQYEIRVTIENAGKSTVASDFWVDLYIDPSGPIAVNVLWNHVGRYGKAWYVRQDLLPGQQLVLSTKDPDDPTNPGDRYSNWPGRFSGPGEHLLWALVDSYGLPSVGAVVEATETNNLLGPLMYIVSASAAPYQGPTVPLDTRPMPGR